MQILAPSLRQHTDAATASKADNWLRGVGRDPDAQRKGRRATRFLALHCAA